MIDLTNVAIFGAAGKMGKGIALLLLQAMAMDEAKNKGAVGTGSHLLHLIDVDDNAFPSLKLYLKKQLLKFAEKNINTLRKYYSNDHSLVGNHEIIQAFLDGAIHMVMMSSEIGQAKRSKLVFEAIVEDVEIKKTLFARLKVLCSNETLFLTNTSSIPISILEHGAGLDGRIIGFHFYNPPPVQRLVEIILSSKSSEDVKKKGDILGAILDKTLIYSNDVAGFIGNGHFIREVIYASKTVHKLMHEHDFSSEQAIYIVNKITRDYLIRPMGIFQLVDYVGIDVVCRIATVMQEYLPISIQAKKEFNLKEHPLFSVMLEHGIIGGQHPDGSQKDGFFSYEQGNPIGIYQGHHRKYDSLHDSSIVKNSNQLLGIMPEGQISWKKLQNDSNKKKKLEEYFNKLSNSQEFGSRMALGFLKESKNIANLLVDSGVAQNIKDVGSVLKFGFFHLYAPDEVNV